MLRNSNEEEGSQIAERLRAGVAAMKLDMGERSLAITVSIGVARLNGDDLPASIRNADSALYRAKALDRNLVCSASGKVDVASAQCPQGPA